ncbi:uncharacterized protein L203_105460 [Cryptococcus depauperatus CBS 7841]|uniref:Uncharacterized protein n=1 Tax=Cryptococcus depauperatus CBS 7841 TaxID=1295531 RepID=A0A1E3IDA0_9TREE|nr:hypothetical protein L203_04137 [Cryptococcus depauperatus CBS 7841]
MNNYRNSQSYSHPYSSNEERDEPFDVRADFDVKGPRWSEMNGLGSLDSPAIQGNDRTRGSVVGMAERASYRPVEQHVPPLNHTYSQDKASASREELVSVPVLGPEWRKVELHDLSRRGQSEIKDHKRKRAWRAWTRDQRGLFGTKWLTRRVFIFFVFFFLAALGVTLYFVIPRVPSFTFYKDQPWTVNNDTIAFSRTPTNFSFAGNLNIYGDASSSYLPVHFKHLEATLYDETTNKKIATGDWGNHMMAHKAQQPVILPVNFVYSTVNASDPTWSNMYKACGHIWTGTVRPSLKFRLVLKMSIVGLTNKPAISTQIGDVACPFELSANNV